MLEIIASTSKFGRGTARSFIRVDKPNNIVGLDMAQITFITGNERKAKQIEEFLNIKIAHQKLDFDELQSLDLYAITEHKARQAYNFLRSPVLVEDVSLTFSVLNELPGPLIKWFLESLGNEGLCKLLDGYDDRSAQARVVFAYFDGVKIDFFDAEIAGKIIKRPHGESGFGFDHIFVPDGQYKTWAEIDVPKNPQYSMRITALRKFEKFLEKENAKK